jgi:hypothetical protein
MCSNNATSDPSSKICTTRPFSDSKLKRSAESILSLGIVPLGSCPAFIGAGKEHLDYIILMSPCSSATGDAISLKRSELEKKTPAEMYSCFLPGVLPDYFPEVAELVEAG